MRIVWDKQFLEYAEGIKNFIGKYPDKVFEYEWRLHVDQKTFDKIKFQLMKEFKYTHAITDVFEKGGNKRRIVDAQTGKTEYQQKGEHKEEISTSFILRFPTGQNMLKASDYQRAKYSVSSEQSISLQQYGKGEDSFVRQRDRTTFTFPDLKIDMTIQRIRGKIDYQIEIELFQHDFSFTFTNVAMSYLFPNIPTLFTSTQRPDRSYVSSYGFPYNLTPNSGIRPVNIMQSHIDTGLYNYWVTNKLDGEAYSLFTVYDKYEKTYKLFMRNATNVVLLSNLLPDEDTERIDELTRYQLRCEYFRNEIHLYDVVSIHKEEIDRIPFSARIEIMNKCAATLRFYLQTSLDVHFKVYVKQFFDGRTGNTLYNAIEQTSQYILQSSPTFEDAFKDNDGIIFQPEWPQNKVTPLKWKYITKISIDFKLWKQGVIKDKTLYTCQVFDYAKDKHGKVVEGNTSKNILDFQYKTSIGGKEVNMDAAILVGTEDTCDGVKCSDLDGFIVECTFQKKDSKTNSIYFTIHRIRWDKEIPNWLKTAKDTLHDMLYPLTLPTLIDNVKQARQKVPEPRRIEEEKVDKRDSYKKREFVDREKQLAISNLQHINLKHQKFVEEVFPSPSVAYTQQFIYTEDPTFNIHNIYRMNYVHKDPHYDSLFKEDNTVLFFSEDINASILLLSFEILLSPRIMIGATNKNKEMFEHNIRIYKGRIHRPNIIPFVSNDPLRDLLFSHSNQYLLNYSKLTGVTIPPINTLVMDVSNMKDFQIKQFISELACKQPTISNILFFFKDKRNHEENNRIINVIAPGEHPMGNVGGAIIFSYYQVRGKVREENNTLKRTLLDSYATGKKVLDLGSGKGGDLIRYKNKALSVLMTEPNDINFKELLHRIDVHQKDTKTAFSTMNIPIQDILSKVKESDFTLICLFFVLTFFFESEDKLDTLIHTISQKCASNGYFIGSTVIGTLFEESLRSSDSIHLGDLSINKVKTVLSGVFGKEITFHLAGSETATLQTEWLVDWQTFVFKLAQAGFHLKELHKPLTNSYSSCAPSVNLLLSSTLSFVFSREDTSLGCMLPVKSSNGNFMYISPLQFTGEDRYFAALYNAKYYKYIQAEFIDFALGLSDRFLHPSVIAMSEGDVRVQLLKHRLGFYEFMNSKEGVICLSTFLSSDKVEHKEEIARLQKLVKKIGTLSEIDGNEETSTIISRVYWDSFTNSEGCKQLILQKLAYEIEEEPFIIHKDSSVGFIMELPPTDQILAMTQNERNREIIFRRFKQSMIQDLVMLFGNKYELPKIDQMITSILFLNLVDADNDVLFATNTNIQFMKDALRVYLTFDKNLQVGHLVDNVYEIFTKHNLAAYNASRRLVADTNRVAAARIRMKYLNILNMGLATDYPGMLFDNSNPYILEAFASSRNRYFDNYCSVFPDVDEGSLGNFFKITNATLQDLGIKFIFVNPPYEQSIMDRAIEKCYELFKGDPELVFWFILPNWSNWKGLETLKSNSFKWEVHKKGTKTFIDYETRKKIEPVDIIYVFFGKGDQYRGITGNIDLVNHFGL